MGMIELESMAVEMPRVEGHPNRVEFRGVLTLVDMPSQRPPSGANRHRVLLTRSAAEAALPSLLGMALDYAPSFDRHDVRRKVGIITSADVVGRNLEVGGYLYARDFPEVVEEVGKFGRHPVDVSAVRARAGVQGMSGAAMSEGAELRASLADAVAQLRIMTADLRTRGGIEAAAGDKLGMSFEVTDVRVEDKRSRIWTLTRVMFTGAAILRKEKAAFQDTWIELVASQ